MNSNLAYQEEPREELIGGKVVAMSPRPAFNHNRVAFRIAHIFENYLDGKKCTVIADGTDLFLTEEDRFIPDVMVVCDRDKIRRDGVHGAPDLVVEVLSKSTAKRDRWYKKRGYESAGVPEFWLVDPVHRSIEVYLLQEGRYVLDDVYTLFTQDDLDDMKPEERAAVVTEFKCHLFDDFVISLDEVFREWFQ